MDAAQDIQGSVYQPQQEPLRHGEEAKRGYCATHTHWKVDAAPTSGNDLLEGVPSDFQLAAGVVGMLVKDGTSPAGTL